MCVQVAKTANRFQTSSLLEKILLKQVRYVVLNFCRTVYLNMFLIILNVQKDSLLYNWN